MASELSMNLGDFAFTKQGRSIRKTGGDQIVNVSGLDYSAGTQTIGTSQESLPLGEVATVGWVWLKNHDATNFITYGTITGQLGQKLKPGEKVYFRAANNVVYVKADTAACVVEFIIVAD